MKFNKKLIIGFLILSIALLSNIAYAKPFTEGFGAVFIKINDFFDKEQYKAYSKTIDFVVFALVFIAIYMRGVKFAFKEITKTEKILAVILGLTTAFLMVIGDFSIVALLPFVNWLLYFLLFALIWWLLKGMKSKFWRFVLALVLTLLLLLLFQLLFSGILTGISCPEKALPWLNWLFAILIFVLLMFLLKDIKNVFGRFVLALLLTLVIVLLIIALLKASSIEAKCPEVKSAFSFMDDFTDSLKGVDIGRFSPSTPQFLKDLTLKQVTPPSGLLQQVESPDKKKEEAKEPGLAVGEDGEGRPAPVVKPQPGAAEPGRKTTPAQEVPPKGLEPIITPTIPGPRSSLPGATDGREVNLAGSSSMAWILGLLIAFLGVGIWKGKEIMEHHKNLFNKWTRRKQTIQDILSRIEEVYKNKKELTEKLTSSQKRKETLVLSHDNTTAFLKRIAEEREQGEVYWYEEEPKLGEERGAVGGLNEIERQWIAETRELIKLEVEFIKGLREWRVALGNVNINIEEEYADLEQLIVRAKDSILVLLLRLYGKETQLEHTEEELLLFLDKKHRAELIKEKHRFLKDAAIVKIYVDEEAWIIKTVGEKIEEQNKLLVQLESKIKEAIKKGSSRRRFLAGGVAAGLIAGAGFAEAQDRKIKIISAKLVKDKIISVRFKITDPNPNARYNVRAYLENPETQGPKPIDILHAGLKAEDYTKLFAARGKDGKYYKDGAYNLILGAVTILNGKPFIIQNHVEIRLGAQPQKPEAEQKVNGRRIQIIDFGWDDARKILYYKIKIISTALDKPYNVALYIKPVTGGRWEHGGEYENENPKNLEFTGGMHWPSPISGKYSFFIEVTSGDVKIRSETRVVEIKSQPTEKKKAEELKVSVADVNPKGANDSDKGVRVGTIVKITLGMEGTPEFEIKVFHTYNKTKYRSVEAYKTKDNIFEYHAALPISGVHDFEFVVKDGSGKTGKADVPVHVRK